MRRLAWLAGLVRWDEVCGTSHVYLSRYSGHQPLNMRTITNFTAAKVCKKHRKTNYKFCKDQELVMRRSGGLKCEMILLWAAHTTNCHTNTFLTISYLRTVVHWASWNCRTMVSRAGSMYQILAKIKEMMERLAMLQTTPISTSSSQAVRFDHCLAQNSLQPRLWKERGVRINETFVSV